MASVTRRKAGFALGPETLQFPRDAGYYSLNEHHRERAEWLAASRAARYSKSVTRRVPRARSHGRRDLEPAEGPKGEWRAREPARLAAPRLQSPERSRRAAKAVRSRTKSNSALQRLDGAQAQLADALAR